MRQSHGDAPAQWGERAIRARSGATIGYYVNRNRFPSLDPRQDVVEPLLPFGNSERPDSPFRFASWAAWVRGELRPAPLSRQAVEELTISRTVLDTHE